MPKSTHFHTVHDTLSTDRKFRPEDEGIYQQEKQEFKASEQGKKTEPVSEEEFITEQNEQNKQDED